MARQGYSWAVTKAGAPPDIKKNKDSDYPEHKRAERSYTTWMSGYTEEEVAGLLTASGVECTAQDIELDIRHIQSLLPVKTLIAQNNDRNRILIQRDESANYRALLKAALTTPVGTYIAAGLSPAAPMKEFRAAIGMEEKPGGVSVNVQQNSLNITPTHGVRSSEDVLRAVMGRMAQKQISAPTEAIDAESQTIEEQDPDQELEDQVPDLE